MSAERSLVEAALDDATHLGAWRFLARRTRVRRLYFQLRADGVGWRRARTLARRTRKAVSMVRKEPKTRSTALELILD